MRILFLTPSLSLRMGGSITSLITLARVLARDHKLEIWTSDHEIEHWDSTLSDACEVRVFPLAFKSFFVAPSMFSAMLGEGKTFDVINVFHFWTMTGIVGALIAGDGRVPVLLHTQGIFLPVALNHHRTRKRLAHALGARYLINRFSSAIVSNPIELEFVRRWGFKNFMRVLPTAVTPIVSERGLLRKQLGLSPDIRIVVYLNRFDPIKRVVDMCRAFRMVQDRWPDVVFLCAGEAETPHGREAQSYAESAKLRAHFLGHLGPQEKWNLLADADVLCQYSAQEGHSTALTEAIAAGVPVIASRGCNFDQIAKAGAGFIVDSIEEMADATIRLLTDYELRRQMSENAMLLAQNYTPEAVAAIYYSILGECQSWIFGDRAG